MKVNLVLIFIFALIPIALLPAVTAADGLDKTEKKIVEYVNATTEDAIQVLEDQVNINSGTLHIEGVRKAGEAIRPYFEKIGFEVSWEDMPEEMGRAGNLFAQRRADPGQGRSLLLIGHLDTVFEPDHPFQTFEREKDGDKDVGRGPGVADMKGGNIAILFALKALHEVGALENTNITVALMGDEERAGRPLDIARAGLINAARRSDVALGFETASRDDKGEYATIARRSSTGWSLRVEGRQGHSSGIFSDHAGSGAIFEAARILNAFHEELKGERYLTFNAGIILGGTDVQLDSATSRGTAAGKSNVIPQSAIVTGDIRTLTDEQLNDVRKRMREIVERHLPRTNAEIRFRDGYPSMPPEEGNLKLLELLNEINRDLGAPIMEAFDPGRRGAADISFVAPHVDSALAALGVFGRGAHSPDEEIDLASLPVVIQRTALLIYRLTR